MVRRLLPLILVALTGCALTPSAVIQPKVVKVEVPVAEPVYCETPPLPYPSLPVAGLSGGSKPADTMRAYVATVIILKGMVRQRDDVISGCAPPSSEAPTRSVNAPTLSGR